MNHTLIKFSLVAIVLLISSVRGNSQAVPQEYKEETISGQLDYLEEHTRIYENFRAIREDIFQIITKNISDTLLNARRRISSLNAQTASLNHRIDSLNMILQSSSEDLNTMTRTKNSISVLGMNVNKVTYNSIMWSIMGILVLLLVVGYLTFKQNRSTTLKTRKELNNLISEFEDYKKKTRVEREKTTMEHFNEIKKLKSNLPGSRGG
jgi:chromosome segregation ATPase